MVKDPRSFVLKYEAYNKKHLFIVFTCDDKLIVTKPSGDDVQ